VISLILLVPIAHTFSPCLPPRFDVFSDKIVGSWQRSDGTVLAVDEVMRSCGGAVQGIQDDSLYLNRADDGFCFFDCGTYSYGPITYDDVASTTDCSGQLITSFALATNARIIVRTTTRPLLSSSESNMFKAILARTYRVQDASSTSWTQDDLEVSIIARPKFTIERQVQCRMSSPQQSWMMQRVRWESTYQGSNVVKIEPQGPYRFWVEQMDRSMMLGISCVETGYVKELVRTYGDSGMLTIIRLQDGMLL
jgi:hypothetical protein